MLLFSQSNLIESLCQAYTILFPKYPDDALICLQSLTKIFSARVSIFSEKVSFKAFKKQSFDALFYMLQTFSQEITLSHFKELVEGMIRIVNNIGINKMRKMEYFGNFFDLLSSCSLRAIEGSINIQSNLVVKIFELWRKIIRQFKSNAKIRDFTSQIQGVLLEISRHFIMSFIKNSEGFWNDYTILKFKRFKKDALNYFTSFYDVAQENRCQILEIINKLCNEIVDPSKGSQLIQHQQYSPKQLSCLILLVIGTHLTADMNERGLNLETDNVQELSFMGSNLALCLKLFQLELAPSKQNLYFELSLMIFMEIYGFLTLEGIATFESKNNPFECSSKLHLLTAPFLGTEDYSKTIEAFSRN